MHVQKTLHGFELIQWTDQSGEECSCQSSSPNLYLGIDRLSSQQGRGARARMALSREQVAELVKHLSCWLGNGSFQVKEVSCAE